MSMSMPELERALKALRLSGMIATLQARAQQVALHETDFTGSFRMSSIADVHDCWSDVSRSRG